MEARITLELFGSFMSEDIDSKSYTEEMIKEDIAKIFLNNLPTQLRIRNDRNKESASYNYFRIDYITIKDSGIGPVLGIPDKELEDGSEL